MMKKIDPITKLLVLLFSMLLILTACNVRTYGDPNAEPDSGSGKATKHYDNFVYLTNPPENYTFAADAPPPVFSWDIKKTTTNTYVLEIDYKRDGTYMEKKVIDTNICFLSENDWEEIKKYAPVNYQGTKKIQWRIRVDETGTPGEPYYTAWTYFWIKAE